MAYDPQLETGEKLIRQFSIKVAKKVEPFVFAVSDQAVYWPAKKLVALSDPYYFRRIRLNKVQEVVVRRVPPYPSWAAAGVMIVAGLCATYLMLEPLLNKTPGHHRVSGWPFAILVGGVILPFAAKGRFGLRVITSDKEFRWKPPLVVDSSSKQKVSDTLDEILAVCGQAGLRVKDERRSQPA